MKKKLLLALSLFFAAQLINAQSRGSDMLSYHLHGRVEGSDLTIDCTPEQVAANILDDLEGEYCLYPNTTLKLHKRQTDKYGNHHLTFNQLIDGRNDGYQTILHFRPDGSLYYVNGNVAIMKTAVAALAKSRGMAKALTAEQAALIATGNAASQARYTLVNHRDVPREVYKVRDEAKMRYVYVDVYSGEVLFAISMLRHFAPWDELHGTPATLPAKITYKGTRSIDVLQIDNGYVLRDPKRNIVTLDATDRLDNYAESFPWSSNSQLSLLCETSDDVVFADQQQLLTSEYATMLKGITFNYHTRGTDVPGPIGVQIYNVDEDEEPLDSIFGVSFSEADWESDFDGHKIVYTLDPPVSLDLLESRHKVEFKWEGNSYAGVDVINAGNKAMLQVTADTKLACKFGVGVDATQTALDVHWGVQKAYDMYHDYFGINGCDNQGTPIVNIVNPTNQMSCTESLPANSFATYITDEDWREIQDFIMIYGLGMTGIERTITSLDITAHEYTHDVINGCGNRLQYINESGALNEATADCMAMIAEYYVEGQPSWEIGNEVRVYMDNMRSFSDPWLSGSTGGEISDEGAQPKYYGGRYWVDYNTADYDQGGVHTNSGVFNHLFYLLCEGAQGTVNEMGARGYISPIGIDEMKDILFHSMYYYNSGLCDYSEIADNLLMVAEDMHRQNQSAANDVQQKMYAAFEYVGMSSTVEPTGIASHRAADAKQQNSSAVSVGGIAVGEGYRGIVIKNGKKELEK